MNLSTILQAAFPKSVHRLNPQVELRNESFFLDNENHKHYQKYGWCVLKNVVNDSEIKSFADTFEEICELERLSLDTNFMNTGCHVSSESRSKTQNIIRQNVKTILPRAFDMNKVETDTGGSYVVKPAHEKSDLATHQDSSFIDEDKDYTLFLWAPFCDITETNGPVWVLSGSHLWGNTQRGLCVPWNLNKHIPIMNKYMHPVLINKGDILVFDPALVHGSGPNLSDKTRHAITISVLRKNSQLVFYYKNKELSPDQLEKYYVNEQFFNEYDFSSKPDENKWKKEVIKHNSFDLSEKELIKIIEKYLPE